MSTPVIESVDADTPLEDLVAIIERDGCVIIRNLISPGLADRLLQDVEPWLQRVRPGTGDSLVLTRTTRLHRLVTKSPVVGELLTNDTVLGLVDSVLGPWCDVYQLNATSMPSIHPGEKPQDLHRDDLIWPLSHPSERNACCTFFWALTDFTASNGATRLIPGSHRWDDEREPREEETLQAIMPKGSVCGFVGSLYHGASANRSDTIRRGLFAGYCLGRLKQEENQYLAVPPSEARKLPRKLQRLIGYQLHQPFLNWLDHQDPIVALDEDYQELSSTSRDLLAEDEERPVQSRRVGLT